jgi:hypothetical protein
MKKKIVELRQDDHNGLCPKCHRTDGYRYGDVPDIWFICKAHRMKWIVGSGLFSSWQYMSDESLLRQKYLLADFQTVEPFFYPREDDGWILPADEKPIESEDFLRRGYIEGKIKADGTVLITNERRKPEGEYMQREFQKHLERVLNYLEADEKKDFIAEGEPGDHIFHDVHALRGWLNKALAMSGQKKEGQKNG